MWMLCWVVGRDEEEEEKEEAGRHHRCLTSSQKMGLAS